MPFLFPVLADGVPFADEEEGEAFDFDDSGDDIPQADCPPPAPADFLTSNCKDQSQDNALGHSSILDPPKPSSTSNTDESSAVTVNRSSSAGGSTAEGTSAAEGADDREIDLPPPPPLPLPLDDDTETDSGTTG